MKTVSRAYKKSMKQILRNPSFVKIVFQNIDTSAATDGEWEDNGHEPFSELETLNYERTYGRTFATLELNRWALDGGLDIYNGNPVTDGFVSDIMSDTDGLFSTVPSLTREFTAIHSMAGLTVSFDTRCGEYPVILVVEFYLSGTLVDTLIMQNLTGSYITVSHPVAQYDKIVIYPTAILPQRRFRMECVLFGVTRQYENNEIISTAQSHDVDPLSRRLPDERFSFTILDFEHNYDPDNPQGIYAYVEEKSPVSITFGYQLSEGNIEWVKADRYLLNAKPSTRNDRVTFNATGLIGSMTDNYYKDVVGTKNLYDLAEAVLMDAGLTLTPSGAHPWKIDESLKTMYTTAVLPVNTHMSCLQLIAHAARCKLYTDDDNIIHIEPFTITMLERYNGTTSDNGHESFSEWESVDAGNTSDKSYTTLELNRWVLEEENQQEIVPDENADKLGYIGNGVSNANGSYGTLPVITRVFDNYCNLNALRIQFDTSADEWVRSLRVQYYRDSTLIDTQTVTDIDESEVSVTSALANEINRIEISILSASPYRRCRITKMCYRTSDFYLDFTTISERSQVITKIDQLKSISVSQYSYLVGDEAITLYNETTEETKLHVEFAQPAQNVQINVSGGTLESSEIYGRAVDLVMSAGTKTVTITGVPLTESVVTINTTVNATGEVDIEENPLITNEAMRIALTNHVIGYLSMRNTYDMSYRGNPEIEVGDLIGMQTRYTDDMPVLVLTDEITFNGALRGQIKAKGLN